MASEATTLNQVHFSRILADAQWLIQQLNLNRTIDGLEKEQILPTKIAEKLKNIAVYHKCSVINEALQGKGTREFKSFLTIVAAEANDSKYYTATKEFFSSFVSYAGYEEYATWPHGK